jgi:hypothetical protein
VNKITNPRALEVLERFASEPRDLERLQPEHAITVALSVLDFEDPGAIACAVLRADLEAVRALRRAGRDEWLALLAQRFVTAAAGALLDAGADPGTSARALRGPVGRRGRAAGR